MKVCEALATDYDGTIAHHGTVDPATIDSLQQLRNSGRKLLLVTGREIPDLLTVFPEPRIFDLIVAENGALLYWPENGAERPLAAAPPREFAERLRARAVNTLSVGRVIVATTDPYEGVVKETLAELNLDLAIIPNKGSLMMLPRGVDKGFGLRAALKEFGLSEENVVAVGDAENDIAFFAAAGYSVAVDNALETVKQRADWVAPAGHGAGVRALIERIFAGGSSIESPADVLPGK